MVRSRESLLPLGVSEDELESLQPLGEFFDSLAEDRSWIKRRVETVELLDLARWSRHVTLDISWFEIQSRARSFHIAPGQKLPLPFATLPKGLQLDVNVVGDHGRPLSVLVSEQDSTAAALAEMQHFAVSSKRVPSHADFEDLQTIALADAADDDRSAAINASFRLEHRGYDASRLRTTMDSYWMMVEIEPDAPTFILKYEFVQSRPPGLRSVREALGLQAELLQIGAEGVGSAQREHLRIVAPPGLFLDGAELYEEQPLARATHRRRVTPERAVIYTKGVKSGDYFLIAGLRVRPGNVLIAGLLWSIGNLILAGFGLAAVEFYQFLDGQSSRYAGPVVALILAVNSLGLTNVLRENDQMARLATLWIRLPLLGSASLTVISFALVFLNGAPWVVTYALWASGFSASASFAITLAASVSSVLALYRTQRGADDTEHLIYEAI